MAVGADEGRGGRALTPSEHAVEAEAARRRTNADLTKQPPEFYKQFNVIICGLDSVEARRWINATVAELVEYDEQGDVDMTTVIPIIDGGTEGFKGQARVILPRLTACFECTLDLFPPRVTFPMCTIAHTPRLPEHCVEWASSIAWPAAFPRTRRIPGEGGSHPAQRSRSCAACGPGTRACPQNAKWTRTTPSTYSGSSGRRWSARCSSTSKALRTG